MEKFTETTKLNKTKDQKIKAYCTRCKLETNHMVIQSIDYDAAEVVGCYEGHPETINWSENYQIIQCLGCESISFRQKSWFSEAEQQIGEDEWDDGTTIRLYPHRLEKTRPIKDYHNIPTILRHIYRETLECYNNNALILCAAGLRAMIEGLCADQKVLNGPVEVPKKGGGTQTIRSTKLEGKIVGLCEKGILTQPNALILHEHRFLGNDAVHELKPPSLNELSLAIDIIEHTLDELYEMLDKAEELKVMRNKRTKREGK